MNKRIKKLAKQAYEDVIKNTPSFLVTKELYEQKFAELIVEECAEIADVEQPNSLGCGYITKTKGMLIKEHFGVKE